MSDPAQIKLKQSARRERIQAAKIKRDLEMAALSRKHASERKHAWNKHQALVDQLREKE